MEEPIRRMLGLTKARFEDVIAGKESLGGHTGPDAIGRALDAIDLDRAIAHARADVRSGRKGVRDAAVRKLGYLKSARRLGLHPRDWMLDRAPVLPPVFRPVSVMAGSKLPMVADANYLYKELIEARDNLKDMQGRVGDVSEERAAHYAALKAVAGLGDPLHPKNRERGVRGVLKQIFGGSPKTGMVQRKLLASATDLVGRATIVPNPDLDMDQVGLPESRAWDVYQPFIVRRLVRRGMSRVDAVRAVRDRKPAAREAMEHEMDARPVIINRAPVHHRYGIMAFRPRLEQGETLQVPPLIVTGFGADFDGDAMQYHVPATDEAVKDAYDKMLPSRNLLAASSFKAHQLPKNEYAGGLYSASTLTSDKRPRVFATKADALAAYRRGEINADQPVEIVMDR
jgi:DNA-directed RNA polymerase subunit beta'